MKKYNELIRLKHWIKNLIIFIPLFFSKTFYVSQIYNTFLGFISFSLMSSVIYIINDIKDIEKDRKHPIKKNRPLANNSITIKESLIIAIILFIISIIINSLITKSIINSTLIYLIIYAVINIFYSFGLKNIPILDVFLLASGFIIRIYYGAEIISVNVSKWLFLTILSASLFLGFNKRRKEKNISLNTRKVLEEYDINFLNNTVNIFSTLLIIFYSLWAFEQNNNLIIYTVILVIYIILQYIKVFEQEDIDDPVQIMYENKTLMFTTIIYIIIMFICII